MPKKKKDTITVYNKDKEVTKEISIREFRDMIWWTWCWSWMKFAEDNKNKDTVSRLFDEYNKNKIALEDSYDNFIISECKWKKEHIDLMSRTAFYVHVEDKKLMIEKYPHILDKLINVFWEEWIENWFQYLIEWHQWPIINMSDMFLSEENLDEYITKWYSAESAYDEYREELEKYQSVDKAI